MYMFPKQQSEAHVLKFVSKKIIVWAYRVERDDANCFVGGPPWQMGLARSTIFHNKQTDTSHNIRPEDIGQCSLLKSVPSVKWDAYLTKTFVYSTFVHMCVENKHCSPV